MAPFQLKFTTLLESIPYCLSSIKQGQIMLVSVVEKTKWNISFIDLGGYIDLDVQSTSCWFWLQE